ncbi:MAG TPA: type II secretion system protein M [Burkholderiales bacterium]|nr:type II secretion system protein M [Burkholderiales bacterium]
MIENLRGMWQARAPRERLILLALIAVVAVALYCSLLYSAHRALPQLRANVLSLREDALRVEQLASEAERLRAVHPPPASQTDLRTLVQTQVASAGLTSTLVRLDAPDPTRVQAVFGAVAFADWLNWVVALSMQNIRLETCRIEALSKPGLVSVTATFVRPGQQ